MTLTDTLKRAWTRLIPSSARTSADARATLVDAVLARRETIRLHGDAALVAAALAQRDRARGGASERDMLVDTFALASEISRRRLGLDPFPVQLEAAVALHQGQVVEMGTGEGKTLAAALVAILHGLSGLGVHALTANDYLAARDAEWMQPVHSAFGLVSAAVGAHSTRAERRAAYAADITHATANEVGFDLLRDHLALEPAEVVHRPFRFAIIDEADSILLDEARIPLVVAGGDEMDGTRAPEAARLVAALRPGVDYRCDRERRNVELTERGEIRIERALGIPSLHDGNAAMLAAINVALHAEALLRRDVDYIVRDGIHLVDGNQGRLAARRRWPDGIHAALEAKEGLPPTPEGRILSSITVENLLGSYPALCGMSGTARTPTGEIEETYGLPVAVIPPHRPSRRVDLPDRLFATKRAKETAVVETIGAACRSGRPVLVGTSGIAESEQLAGALARTGVPCRVLNARDDAHEAAIIARAGDVSVVTISTNMAGRGTDVRLGGTDGRTSDAVRDLGGLLVIGTNRHESRRIDDQLRGRAGRQGDPGQTQFFVSLEDDLLARHGIASLIERAAARDGAGGAGLTAEIARAQRIIEGENHAIRKTLRQYSLLLEQQRRTFHARRSEWLRGEGLPLDDAAWARHEAIAASLGAPVAGRAARLVVLSVADDLWSDHLALAADVREGIHLRSLGQQDPLHEFNRILFEAFAALERDVEDRSSRAFLAADIGPEGIDLAREGLARPSATWTYLVTDRPFGSLGDRIARGLARAAGV